MFKNLLLSSIFFISSFTFGQDLLKEDFENGIPPNWEVKTTDPNRTWHIKPANSFDYLKTNIAAVDGHDGSDFNQNEWLISPSIDLSNAESPYMEFTIASNPYYLKKDTDFFIKVSTDNGQNWTIIWDDTQFFDDGSFSFIAIRLHLDLEKYKGEKNVHVAFHYYATGSDRVTVLMDNIEIHSKKDPYCFVFFSEDLVAPITNFKMANIDNSSSGDTVISHEKFLDKVVNVQKGQTYTASVKANHLDSKQMYSYLYIDWNHNGVFGGPEIYKIGNSDPINPATINIKVPDYALPGKTRIRVVNTPIPFPFPICGTSSGGGQVEDYSLNIIGDSPDQGDNCNKKQLGIFEDGFPINHSIIAANDFLVHSQTKMTLKKIQIDSYGILKDINIHFYENNNGKPGKLLQSFSTLNPTDKIIVDEEKELYKLTYTFSTPIIIQTGENDELFWFAIDSKGYNNSWGFANKVENNPTKFSEDNGATWIDWSNGLIIDGAFEFVAECEMLQTSEIYQQELTYYPNPVKDNLNIKSTKEIAEVNIINLTGQVVKRDTIINDKLNTSNLPSGTFIIKIIYKDNSSKSFKIIKK